MNKVVNKKICAIICEYNPFHNGHKYLIDEVKKQTGCDYVLGIMSGNFSQRGEACILDKYDRSTLACKCGVDAIIALPTAYSISSSEVFALAGVKIASSFKNVTHLAFGSECGDIEILKKCAEFFSNESNQYSKLLRSYLKQGYSYNASRLKALEILSAQDSTVSKILDVISRPNNILAIEYLKALKRIGSDITPFTVTRIGEYNSDALTTFSSASAIRKATLSGQIKKLAPCMPDNIYPLYKDMIAKSTFDYNKNLDNIALFELRNMSPAAMRQINDVTEGIENNIISSSLSSTTVDEVINNVASKRYTETKVRRIILSSLLGVTKDVIKRLYVRGLPYIKVLAVSNKDVLSYLDCSTTLLTRSSDKRFIISKYYADLVNIENRADNLYAVIMNKTNKIPYLNQKALFVD